MKRILPFMLMALVALISKHAVGQACPIVCPEKIDVTKACDSGPGWWQWKMGIINQTNGTASVRVWEENGSYDTVLNITGHKDRLVYIVSKPFHSVANPPKLHWKTFTGSMGNGTSCGGDALPVKFKSLTAKKDDNSVLITADVAIENLQGALTLEHSYDGREFKTITTFAINEQQSVYTYRDYPDKGKKYVYYRLQGENKYSNIVTVAFSEKTKAQHVFNGQALSLYYIPVGAKITILSPDGRVLVTTVATNENQIVPFANKPKGTYLFSVENREGKYSGIFLVQ